MTALSKDAQRVEKRGKLLSFKVKGGVIIYKNALVAIDAGGFVVPAADDAAHTFLGMAYERVTATDASDGELEVRVELSNSFEVEGSGFAQADILDEVFVVDDNTVAKSSTNSVRVGRIVEVLSATKVMVQPLKATK